MKNYRDEVKDIVDLYFSAFNLQYISKEVNELADSLAIAFRICIYPNKKYEINVRHRHSIPDNTRHWQVFEDDQQIRRFLERTDEFLNTPIDKDEDETTKENLDGATFLNAIIIQLNNNIIPRGLVPFEKLFDSNDVALKAKIGRL